MVIISSEGAHAYGPGQQAAIFPALRLRPLRTSPASSRLRRFEQILRLSLVLLVLLLASRLPAVQMQDYDRPVVYVNETVITWGDVRDRVRLSLELMQAQGVMPRGTEELQALERKARKALVDEELLYQEALRLEVRIPRARVRRLVVEQARRTGVGNDMRSVAEEIERRERQEMIQQVLQFYESVQPDIGPEALRERYEANKAQYRRPGRIHLYQLAISSADATAIAALQQRLLALVRVVRGHGQEPIRTCVSADFVDQVVEATGLEQRQLLMGLVERLLAVPELASLDPDLHAEASNLQQQAGALRSRQEAEALVRELRQQIQATEPAQRVGRFQVVARSYSNGTEAEHGGDHGWLELGALTQAQQQALDDVDERGVSEPFWSGNACLLVMPGEIEQPQQRSLAEVSGELQSVLGRQQRDQMREELMATLRSRSQVTYLP
jgi:hypothetical protein